MELDCQRMEATPPEMRPVFYFLTSFSGNVGLEGNQVYGRKSILVYNTEFHTVSQTSYCDHVQGCLSAS